VPSEDVRFWLSLASARKSGFINQIPTAPSVDTNRWAISGIAGLGDALSWAASSTEGSERDRWLFQRGAWLAGRGETDSALDVLVQSSDDRARALSGRLWLVHRRDAQALHPQVVIERDKALAALGTDTLAERGRWLDVVSALEDEWLAERRAGLLIDSGDSQAAFNVLMNTRFQLVH
jgi:hypothetical protein